jgi:peptidoglycan/LPS O-acetylase OafA/YrhL
MGTLRLFLAFSVLAWHLRPLGFLRLTAVDGGIAVISFFIISGFYMSMVISQKYRHLPNGRSRFFINRFLRIFPLYFVAMVLQQAVFSIDHVKTVFTSSLGYSLPTHVTLIFLNLFKFGQDYWQTFVEAFSTNQTLGISSALQRFCSALFGSNAFVYNPGALLVAQGWSLASELTYYLIAPLVVGVAWYYATALGLASLAIRFAFLFTLGGAFMGSWRTKFFPSIFVFFILGHFAYLLYEKVKDSKYIKSGELIFVASWAGIIGFSFYNGGFLLGYEYDGWVNWVLYVFVALSIPFLFSATKDSKLDGFIGEFSYPVYLIHPAIIELEFQHVRVPPAVHYVSVVTGVLLVSYLMIVIIDRPINKLRDQISKQTADLGLVAALSRWKSLPGLSRVLVARSQADQ